MADANGIKLEGQGTSLPPYFGYYGDWIIKDRLFLFRPMGSNRKLIEDDIVRVEIDGTTTIGFNAETLGFRLKTGIMALIEHNRAGTLDYLGSRHTPLQYLGRHPTVEYIFRCAGTECTVTS